MSRETLDPTNMANALAGPEMPIPRYDLVDDELDAAETSVISFLSEHTPPQTKFATLLVDGGYAVANFGRTYEQRTFDGEDYNFAAGMASYETHSSFLYTADLELGAIGHTKRIVAARSPQEIAATGRTGLEMIDDRLNATDQNEAASLEDILDANGITSPQACFNIATNQTTTRAPWSRERPYILFSYKSVFELARERSVDHVLAYVNLRATRSLLGRLGVDAQLLGGKPYHLPLVNGQGYDERYEAVCINASQHNIATFTQKSSSNPYVRLMANSVVPRVTFTHPSALPAEVSLL